MAFFRVITPKKLSRALFALEIENMSHFKVSNSDIRSRPGKAGRNQRGLYGSQGAGLFSRDRTLIGVELEPESESESFLEAGAGVRVEVTKNSSVPQTAELQGCEV